MGRNQKGCGTMMVGASLFLSTHPSPFRGCLVDMNEVKSALKVAGERV